MKQTKQQVLYFPKNLSRSHGLIIKLAKHLNYLIHLYEEPIEQFTRTDDHKNSAVIICVSQHSLDLVNQHKDIEVMTPKNLWVSLEQMTCSLLVLQKEPLALLKLLEQTIEHSLPTMDEPLFIYQSDEAEFLLQDVKPQYTFVGDLHDLSADNLALVKRVSSQTQENVVFNWDQEHSRNLSKSVPNKRLSFGSIIGCDVRLYQTTQKNHATQLEILIAKDLHVFQHSAPQLKASDILGCLCLCHALQINQKQTVENLQKQISRM